MKNKARSKAAALTLASAPDTWLIAVRGEPGVDLFFFSDALNSGGGGFKRSGGGGGGESMM